MLKLLSRDLNPTVLPSRGFNSLSRLDFAAARIPQQPLHAGFQQKRPIVRAAPSSWQRSHQAAFSTHTGYNASAAARESVETALGDGQSDQHGQSLVTETLSQKEHKAGNYLKDFASLLPPTFDFKRTPTLKPRRIRSPRPRIYKIVEGSAHKDASQSGARDRRVDEWQILFDILSRNGAHQLRENGVIQGEPSYRNVSWLSRRKESQDQFSKKLPKRPISWNKSRFGFYVQAMIDFKPPATLFPVDSKQRGEEKKLPGLDDRIALIENVFHEPYLRKFISVEVGNAFLSFLYHHSKFQKARALRLHLEHIFGELPTSTWNIVLNASVSRRDFASFVSHLKIMARRRISLDSQTWIMLLMILTSTDGKREVVKAMFARGLMRRISVRREVASHMCLSEWNAHRSLDSEPLPFSDLMDQKYGSDWISTSAVNKLLGEILLRPKSGPKVAALYRGLRLLNELQPRGLVLDGTTMDIFLNSLRQIGREDLIIEVLGVFRNEWKVVPDRQAHWRLFQFGWRRRKYNFLRTVWASACLKGFVTRSMCQVIRHSMLSYDPSKSAPDAGQLFRNTIGWFLTSLYGAESIAEMTPPDQNLVPPDVCAMALESNINTLRQGNLPGPLHVILQKSLAVDTNWDFFRALSGPQARADIVQSNPISIVKTGSHRPMKRKDVEILNQDLRKKVRSQKK